MLDGIINVIPNAKVGHIGLYRDEETFQPIEYYFKMPENIEGREVLIIEIHACNRWKCICNYFKT